MNFNQKSGVKLCLIFFIFVMTIILPTQTFNQDNLDIQKDLQISSPDSLTSDFHELWGGSQYDTSEAIAQDSEGNIYIGGYTSIASSFDFFYVKYDHFGEVIFNRTWGGGNNDQSHDLIVDASSNLYLAGWSVDYGGVLVQFDQNNNKQWHRSINGAIYGIALDTLNNIYVVGRLDNTSGWHDDYFLAKYNTIGDQLWNNSWGGPDDDICFDLVVDSFNNIYITGTTESLGSFNYDISIAKYNNVGDLQWHTTWGGTENERSNSIAMDSNGSIYITGFTYSYGEGERDVVLLKYNNSGTLQWNKTWGGPLPDEGKGIDIDAQDNIFITGGTYSFSTDFKSELFIVIFDSSGEFKDSFFWGEENSQTSGNDLIVDSYNLYIVGSTSGFGAGGTGDACLLHIVYNPIQMTVPSDNSINPLIILLIILSIILPTSIGSFVILSKRKKIKKRGLIIEPLPFNKKTTDPIKVSDNLKALIISNVRYGSNRSKTIKHFIKFFKLKLPSELNEVYELIIELLSINFAFFWNSIYNKCAEKLEKQVPLNEFLDFEKKLVEDLFLIEEINEVIQTHLLGKFTFPRIEASIKGHIFITNYRIILPRGHQLSTLTSADALSMIPLMRGTAQRRANKINRRRKEFNNVIAQQKQFKSLYKPGEAFIFGVPFNLKVAYDMSFSMIYKYKTKKLEEKNYKLDLKIKPIAYKNESQQEFFERKKFIFSTITDVFSQYPTIICHKCFQVQDRTLDSCVKCGTTLKPKI